MKRIHDDRVAAAVSEKQGCSAVAPQAEEREATSRVEELGVGEPEPGGSLSRVGA